MKRECKVTTTKEPKYVAETLKWCNSIREKMGKKPLKRLPRGVRKDASSCPCGKATGLFVYDEGAFVDTSTKANSSKKPIRRGNQFVRMFIDKFDGGKLPQYEAKE
jgi:hypothetical protein